MKKFLKYFAISLASLVLIFAIIGGVASWIIFTPERITPILNKEANKMLNCDVEIGRVELTFFSTFPKFGLQMTDFVLINPIEEAQSDTLASVDKLVGAIDLMAFLRKNELHMSDFSLNNGNVNVFVDDEGNANYDIYESDTTDTDDSEFKLSSLDLGFVQLNNINLSYLDKSMNMTAGINNLYAEIKAVMIDDKTDTDIKLKSSSLSYFDESYQMTLDLKNIEMDILAEFIGDSIKTDLKIKGSEFSFIDEAYDYSAFINEINFGLKGLILNDSIKSVISISGGEVDFDYEGEKYLSKTKLELLLPSEINIARYSIDVFNGIAKTNDLEFTLNGKFEMDPDNYDIITDIDYKIEKWRFVDILKLIPPDYIHYLDGIITDGYFSSDGNIAGIYNDSLMPFLDLNLKFEHAHLSSPDIPYPLKNINGDVQIYTDMIRDDLSYVRINSFRASTPKSVFETRGVVKNLYSDTYTNIYTRADIDLDEFNSMVPDTMNVQMKGRIKANVQTAFTLSQIENMVMDKMLIKGNLTASNIDFIYDSIWMRTDIADIDFSLPNPKPSSSKTAWSLIKINSGKLETGWIDDYDVYITKLGAEIETGDLMADVYIPDINCSFRMDSLWMAMDTVSLALSYPTGNATLIPSSNPDYPSIKLNYNSNSFKAKAGDIIADIGSLGINVDLLHDASKQDKAMEYLAQGFVSLTQGFIEIPDFLYPIIIPAIKMNFDEDRLEIIESRMNIGKSDFELSGTLQNLIGWINGEALLNGVFNFTSDYTDIVELMELTSGLGLEEAESENTETNLNQDNEDSIDSGPFMVPIGVDVSINTNIKKANYGADVAKDIQGELRIKDGILVLDNMRFTAPAARMNLTLMYRTPRKNHLYAGMLINMMEIEIEDLLRIVPDLDSIMPMLRSFRGKGEFHLAVECYLDSTYNVKLSTLRGASSIAGQNLVLMDGETFSEIAKTLRFTKQAENQIDSLSAEFTIFRNEIDVYPFLLVMDKYSVVVAGRHNVDMSFDYNIDIVESPLPTRLGVGIKGNMEDMKYSPQKPKYPEFYKPASRRAVQSKNLELREMIRKSITEGVSE
jgi:hypothetical protein